MLAVSLVLVVCVSLQQPGLGAAPDALPLGYDLLVAKERFLHVMCVTHTIRSG